MKHGLVGSRSTVPRQESEVEGFPGEAGSARPGEKANAGAAAIAMPADEARPPGIAKQSAMMKPELAETSGEAGPFRSRVNGTSSAAATADAMPAGGARPHGIAKQKATTKPELAERSGEAGRNWSRAGGTTKTAAAAAVSNSADGVRPSGLA